MRRDYDLFISYRHLDAAPVRALADSLRAAGLRIWIDERRIEDLTSIQAAIAEGLTRAKVLLAWYLRPIRNRVLVSGNSLRRS